MVAIKNWRHLNGAEVISMPDKWEYPWFASWDLAFHCLPLAIVDAEFAKGQLVLLAREWYMHPTASCPLTNGRSATRTRRCMRGRRFGCFQIDRKQRREPIHKSWRSGFSGTRVSRSCC